MSRIEVMKRAALQAGEYMRGAAGHTESTVKSIATDFVTVADIKSQDILRHSLVSAFPDAMILSEEDDEEARKALYESDFTGFVLSPIDGTYNFKRDMRESGISIGYIENGQPVAGVIYDPYKDELYEAEVGKGAKRNGELIHVSKQAELSGASVAASNGYDAAAAKRSFLRHIGIYEQTGVMPWTSCPGSAVLTMAWVACGRVDAFHHNGVKPWDNAAAFLLVREAGGVVHDLNGRDAAFTSPLVLLGVPALVAEIETAFQNIDPELLH